MTMDQSSINATTNDAVDKLIRGARWRKWQMVALTVLLAIALYLVFRNHQVVTDLQASGYHSCMVGNVARGTNATIWDDFINLLLKGSKNAVAIKEGHTFESVVAAHEKAQACATLYPQQAWWHFW